MVDVAALNIPVKVFELLAPSAKTPLIEQFTADIKASDLMDPEKVVAQALQAMQHDTWEMYPGMATALRYMSRLAPGFMVKQLSKGLAEGLPPFAQRFPPRLLVEWHAVQATKRECASLHRL